MDGPVGIASPPSTWTLETAYQYATQRAIQPTEPDGEPLYNCPFPPCAKQFSKRFNLKAHLRVHTGDKPFACAYPGCSRRFMWKSSLTSHHTGHSRRNAHMAKRSAAAAAAALARAANAPSLVAPSSTAPPDARLLPSAPFRRSTTAASSYISPQHVIPSSLTQPPLTSISRTSAAATAAVAAATAPHSSALSAYRPPYVAAPALSHAAALPVAVPRNTTAPLPRAPSLHVSAPTPPPPPRAHAPLSQPLPSIQSSHAPPPTVKSLSPLAPTKPEPQALHHHTAQSVLSVPSPSPLAAVAQQQQQQQQTTGCTTPLTSARELLNRETVLSKSPSCTLLPPPSSNLLPSPGVLPRSPGAFTPQLLFTSHTASPAWTGSLSHGAPRCTSPGVRSATAAASDVAMTAAGGGSRSGDLSPLAISPGVTVTTTTTSPAPMLPTVGGGRACARRGAVHRAAKPPLAGPSLTAGASALLPPLAHVAPKNPPTHIDLGGLGEEEPSSSLPALGSPHTELSPLPVASPIFGASQTPTSPIQPFSPFSGGHVSSARSKAPTAWYQA